MPKRQKSDQETVFRTELEAKHFLTGSKESTLKSYEAKESLIKEHWGIEQSILAGGYANRQILELVQNAADAILEDQELNPGPAGSQVTGAIEVVLKNGFLYVANTGTPFSKVGIESLLSSHTSPKRGLQIGRFGIGFKSLLRLGGAIDILTRSFGTIRFDPDRCRQEIMNRFLTDKAPGLRLAWQVPKKSAQDDVTEALLSWAETVIRVKICDEGAATQIQREIEKFPSQFLLFFPVATRLTFEIEGKSPRELSVSKGSEGLKILRDADKESEWLVEEETVELRAQAAQRDAPEEVQKKLNDIREAEKDATGIHARDRIPITWAYPVKGWKDEIGRFWAFFPTDTLSRIPGILNAPWKLNNDRTHIIEGAWNSELIKSAAEIIAKAIPKIATNEDPGRICEAFPRRPEASEKSANELVGAVWKRLAQSPILPDCESSLQYAEHLARHPLTKNEIISEWIKLSDRKRRTKLVHPSCQSRGRSQRLENLSKQLLQNRSETKLPCVRILSAANWISSLIDKSGANAPQALQFCRLVREEIPPGDWRELRDQLKIIPDTEGTLRAREELILAPENPGIPGRFCVRTDLLEDPDCEHVLRELFELETVGSSLWVEGLENLVPSQTSTREAGLKFWQKFHTAPEPAKLSILDSKARSLRFKNLTDEFKSIDQLYLPSSALSDTDPGAAAHLLDTHFHETEIAWLKGKGLSSSLEEPSEMNANDLLPMWMLFWRNKIRERIREDGGDKRPQDRLLAPLKSGKVPLPKGVNTLLELSGKTRCRVTEKLIDLLEKSPFNQPIEVGHRNHPEKYPRETVKNPLAWILGEYGTLMIGETIVGLHTLLENPDLLHYLKNSDVAGKVNCIRNGLDEAWSAATPPEGGTKILLDAILESDPSVETTGKLLEALIEEDALPKNLIIGGQSISFEDVYATADPRQGNTGRRAGLPVVVLSPNSLRIWIERGGRDFAEQFEPIYEVAGEPAKLIEMFPELSEILPGDLIESTEVQEAKNLRLSTGDKEVSHRCVRTGDRLLLDIEEFSQISKRERFREILDALSETGRLEGSVDTFLERLLRGGVREARRKVREQPDIPSRIAAAIGSKEDTIRDCLGPVGGMEFTEGCSIEKLIELALALHGPTLLSQLGTSMEEEGLDPPSRWSSEKARRFVEEIGLPLSFATSPAARRDPEEFVMGPVTLPELHDFQKEVFHGLSALSKNNSHRKRAVVCLPTGGGKTRVTVQSCVELFLAHPGDRRCVLWIAQTDELCEQAVQAFRQVWSNKGSHEPLRIVRLWGGNKTPELTELTRPIAVVGSIQTLNSRIETTDLQWLNRPAVVVVDECHHAITASYTRLLRFLDASTPNLKERAHDEPLILGLSATPFRGSEEESERLANRFSRTWFPENQENLQKRLLQAKVLSIPRYETIESGAEVSDQTLQRLAALPTPWTDFDLNKVMEEINQDLASNTERNELLVERIAKAKQRSILLFANSVGHSKEMAARLNHAGVSAAAVSGETPRAARRYFLDRFQNGEIKVLCNHSVLTTGFDAPKVDMILVARQVFSPIRYMQMVGRGLRGPANGGTPECLIVTILDNLGRFADRQPFHYCKDYFDRMQP